MEKGQKRKSRIIQLALKGGTDKELLLLDEIHNLEDRFDTTVAEIKQETKDTVSKLADPLRGVDMVKIKGPKGDMPNEQDLIPIIKKLIPDPIQGESGKDYILTSQDKEEIATLASMNIEVPIVEKIIERTETIKEIPQITEVIKQVAVTDKAEIIRDKLEKLKDDERLDVSAIKGLNFDSKLEKSAETILFRATSILDNRTSFLINKINNLPRATTGTGTVNSIIAGTGISVDSTDPANPIVIAIGGGGGFTLLPATGSINGNNPTFTFTQQPTYIISDGVWYRVNKGWTWSVLTATMTVPPNDDIYGFV